MTLLMTKDSKERFIKIYANLSLDVRKEIVLVLDDKPVSWNVAFFEINYNTELSRTILEKFEQLFNTCKCRFCHGLPPKTKRRIFTCLFCNCTVVIKKK
mgnify:CR=1 FL=1